MVKLEWPEVFYTNYVVHLISKDRIARVTLNEYSQKILTAQTVLIIECSANNINLNNAFTTVNTNSRSTQQIQPTRTRAVVNRFWIWIKILLSAVKTDRS